MPETFQYAVPVENIPQVMNRLQALSKRAERLGLPPFILSWGDDSYQPIGEGQAAVQCRRLTLTAATPVLGGWRYLGKLERLEGTAENLITTPRPDDIPEAYRACAIDCQHCQTTRNRITSHLLQQRETGQILQVGTSCLTDFTGHDNPHVITGYAELLATLDDRINPMLFDPEDDFGLGDGVPGGNSLRTPDVLAMACAIIRLDGGYESRQNNPHGFGTADVVRAAITKRQWDLILSQDRDLAEAVLDWGRNELPTAPSLSQYLHNLKVLLAAPYVPLKKVGLVASAPAAYGHAQRHARTAAQGNHPGSFLGSPGERIDFIAKLDRTVRFEGSVYGDRFLHLFVTPEGNTLAWTTGKKARDLREGQSYALTGTVDRHEDYKGVLQTHLLRVTCPDLKLLDAVQAGDLKKLAKQLQAQHDISITNAFGENALHKLQRCSHHNVAAAQLLLDAGLDPNVPDDDGIVPLLLAIVHKDIEMARLLIEHGAILDFGDQAPKGMNPLAELDFLDDPEPIREALGLTARLTP